MDPRKDGPKTIDPARICQRNQSLKHSSEFTYIITPSIANSPHNGPFSMANWMPLSKPSYLLSNVFPSESVGQSASNDPKALPHSNMLMSKMKYTPFGVLRLVGTPFSALKATVLFAYRRNNTKPWNIDYVDVSDYKESNSRCSTAYQNDVPYYRCISPIFCRGDCS